ncbi:hypothetical protein P8631_13160, partial [Guyparkeria sp. 1SP6A2]|nr:hypothetical protein [Guyparkeria sp. 1SP6A2]
PAFAFFTTESCYVCIPCWYCKSLSKGHMPLEKYKIILEKQKQDTAERKERQRLIKKIYQLLKKRN